MKSPGRGRWLNRTVLGIGLASLASDLRLGMFLAVGYFRWDIERIRSQEVIETDLDTEGLPGEWE